MWILFGCLLAGGLGGWFRLLPMVILNQAGRGMMLGVWLLLLTMGLRIGADRDTLSQLGSFGGQALLFAVATIIGSVVVVALLERVFMGKRQPTLQQNRLEVNSAQANHSYPLTYVIVGAFAAGIGGGVFFWPQAWTAYLTGITNFILNFTLVMVGMGLGLNRDIWRYMLKVGWQVFLAPAGVVLGSIAAAMAVGLCLGWGPREGGAVGAGFGWYSLSGVLISDLHSVSLGTIAFLSNIFREVLAILLTPFLAKRSGLLTLVAPSGATAMDTNLPLLMAVGPEGTGVVALISGLSLSLLVPVLAPLVLEGIF